MKVIERVFEKKIRKVVDVHEMQMGFMQGKGTIDVMFIRQIMEKYEAAEKNLFMAFVQFEKNFDRVSGEEIWRLFRSKGLLERETNLVIEMYKDTKTVVTVTVERSELFYVKVGVY